MNQPTSRFTGGPAHTVHPAPTPIPPEPGPRWVAAPEQEQGLRGDERLIVRLTGGVTISKPLLLAAPNLGGGRPVDVVPPLRRGGIWHLDTRSTAPRRLPKTGVARFDIPRPSPGLFLNGTGGYRYEMEFQLGAEVAGHPGYYALVPVAPTPKRSETHCRHGHALTPDNLYRAPSTKGPPGCRACKTARDATRKR